MLNHQGNLHQGNLQKGSKSGNKWQVTGEKEDSKNYIQVPQGSEQGKSILINIFIDFDEDLEG